jgi:hypothetical protein
VPSRSPEICLLAPVFCGIPAHQTWAADGAIREQMPVQIATFGGAGW